MNNSTKQLIIKKIEQLIDGDGKNFRILELGSGRSPYIQELLEKFPAVTYVGVEPKSDAIVAEESLKNLQNARVLNQLGYDLPSEVGKEFDICFSLSVLEHVKQLELFLKNSIGFTKQGGLIVHFYDLGHALYPHNFKAFLHVFLGNYFPALLPEYKFVNYVDINNVKKILEDSGAEILDITYHQMPNHKKFQKIFKADTEEKINLITEISEWEFKVSKHLHELDQTEREYLFPSIAVWARKK